MTESVRYVMSDIPKDIQVGLDLLKLAIPPKPQPNGSLFQTGVRPAIDDYLLAEAAKIRDYGDYWSASSAGYCMRKNIFERLGVPHVVKDDDARKQRVFSSGHIFHDWIQGITKAAGLSIAQEVELQDEDLMIRGHFDDLVLVQDFWAETTEKLTKQEMRPNHLILYDYKTVNSRSFLWAKKNGNAMSHYHRYQLGTYMYMLRKGTLKQVLKDGLTHTFNPDWGELSEARILKIEKDTLMMMEQQLLWSPELESEVLNYWKALNTHWQNKTLPACSCADQEGGFMAKEKFNPFWFDDEPCSLELYKKWKKEQA